MPSSVGRHTVHGTKPSSTACDSGMGSWSSPSSCAHLSRWNSGLPSTTQTCGPLPSEAGRMPTVPASSRGGVHVGHGTKPSSSACDSRMGSARPLPITASHPDRW